jgi:hypothetical protein
MPTDSWRPGTYKETSTNTKVAILKEKYPEDKLTDEEQELILQYTEKSASQNLQGGTNTL